MTDYFYKCLEQNTCVEVHDPGDFTHWNQQEHGCSGDHLRQQVCNSARLNWLSLGATMQVIKKRKKIRIVDAKYRFVDYKRAIFYCLIPIVAESVQIVYK
ncbi:hypothetical protein M3Y94_01065800 [Aphelenchoides besseyi]|nr:hypothetical protein M3Y94_01065800 [Aphelenchoides besseyi]